MRTRNRHTALSIAVLAIVTSAAGAAVAQEEASADAAARESAGAASPPGAAAATELDTITVTGTRIRGGEAPSPVITIGSERIREEGFRDLGEVVRSLPQNFSGGQNPGVSAGNLSGAGFANQNVTGGSALNLRGLGPDATLTLLNGRRMAYSGFVQAVDVAAIPVEAVDRIEIVPDGASAIYGSDAVGGVGNVILRRDFDGVSLGARYGEATDGGLATRDYTATAGTYWSDGGFIAAFKDAAVDPIHASQRDYAEHLVPPTTVYPGSGLQSALLSGHQQLGGSMELRLDGLWNRRDQIHYYDWLGTNRMSPETTTSLVSPVLEVFFPNHWTLSLGRTWARSTHHEDQTRTNPVSGATTVVIEDCLCNESRTWEVGAEGPVAALASGDVRLAVGGGERSNAFTQRNRRTGAVAMHGEESARFAYAELHVPLVGAGQDVAWARRLSLTAALRGEDYDSFGRVTTPKLGLVFGPTDGLTAKLSWGRSFKAPTLFQLHQAAFSQLAFPPSFGGPLDAGDDTVIAVAGGYRGLEPERARTWSATLAIHPESIPGLELELGAFHVNYTDRVVQPITDYSQVLRDPTLARFVDRNPTPEELQRIVSTTRFLNFTGVPYDPERVVAVIYGHHVNVARQTIKGLDLSGAHRVDLEAGRLTLRGAVSWLDSTQQWTPELDPVDLSGTLFNPARLNGRFGLVWERGAFTGSLFANHVGGVTNRGDGTKNGSFNTIDAVLRFASAAQEGPWSGVDVTLSAHNLFDRAPPLYIPTSTAVHVAPFDSTNYSAIGRFLGLSVSKHF